MKQVVENHTNIPLEPTPNYDCHLVASVDSSLNHTALFNSSQVNLFDAVYCIELWEMHIILVASTFTCVFSAVFKLDK